MRSNTSLEGGGLEGSPAARNPNQNLYKNPELSVFVFKNFILMQLSKHFSLSEFERSATATKLGIDNSVPSQYIPALEQLCKEILEPLREFAGQPIIISSQLTAHSSQIKIITL